SRPQMAGDQTRIHDKLIEPDPTPCVVTLLTQSRRVSESTSRHNARFFTTLAAFGVFLRAQLDVQPHFFVKLAIESFAPEHHEKTSSEFFKHVHALVSWFAALVELRL